jgi:hypothetical protein
MLPFGQIALWESQKDALNAKVTFASGAFWTYCQATGILSGLVGASNEFPLGAERRSQLGFRRIIGS